MRGREGILGESGGKGRGESVLSKILGKMETSGLSCSQVRHFKAAFNRFDTRNTGVITGKELGKVLRHIGYNPTEAEIQVVKVN